MQVELNVCFVNIDIMQIGFLLGVGETSCDIDMLFQGCSSAKGLITLSVNDLLNQVNAVLLCSLYYNRIQIASFYCE